MSRQSISARLRFEILKRDNFRCQYCGGAAPGVQLEVDHIHPVSQGGTNAKDNLLAACQRCNAGKSDLLLDMRDASPSEDVRNKALESAIATAELRNLINAFRSRFSSGPLRSSTEDEIARCHQRFGYITVFDVMDVNAGMPECCDEAYICRLYRDCEWMECDTKAFRDSVPAGNA